MRFLLNLANSAKFLVFRKFYNMHNNREGIVGCLTMFIGGFLQSIETFKILKYGDEADLVSFF